MTKVKECKKMFASFSSLRAQDPLSTYLRINSQYHIRASLIAQLVKNPPAMQETLVEFLGWEDPLVKGKATHSSILPWRIPWTV